MGFLPKLWKEKFKGKVGHVPVFAEDGTLIDSGKEPGGGGSLTPKDLADVLKGSDDISVDISEDQTTVVVKLDEDKRLYRHDICLAAFASDEYVAGCRLTIISNRSTSYDYSSLIEYFKTHYPIGEEDHLCSALTTGYIGDEFQSDQWFVSNGLYIVEEDDDWYFETGSGVGGPTYGSRNFDFFATYTEVTDTVNQLI